MRLELLRDHRVDRQDDFALGSLRLVQDLARGGDQVASASDLPTCLPCASRKVLAMPPPMISAFDLVEQIAQQVELGRNLGAADDRRYRPFRMLKRLGERFELGLHGAAGIGGQLVAETFGRGMRAVRGREGVVDPDVAELGECRDEGRIVLLLACVEAGVLQAENVAGLHRGDRALGQFADAIVGEGDRTLDDAGDLGGDGLQRFLRVATLWPAEMREQDHLAALVGDLGDGWRGALDAGRRR